MIAVGSSWRCNCQEGCDTVATVLNSGIHAVDLRGLVVYRVSFFAPGEIAVTYEDEFKQHYSIELRDAEAPDPVAVALVELHRQLEIAGGKIIYAIQHGDFPLSIGGYCDPEEAVRMAQKAVGFFRASIDGMPTGQETVRARSFEILEAKAEELG